LDIGIVGLPGSGKTTVFNALAGAQVQVGTFSSAQSAPNRAVVKVPDQRVDVLSEMFQPKSIKPAEVQFVDVAGLAKGAGLESEAAIIGHLRTVDALLLVIGAFLDGASADSAISDLDSLEGTFILSDLEVVDKRVERLEREVRMARGGDIERQTKARELELLARLRDALNEERPVRSVELSDEEHALLRGYGLLSEKPILVVLNTGDDRGASEAILAAVRERRPDVEWFPIAGRLEMELSELDKDDAAEFMEAMGLTELSAGPVIQAAYRVLDRISFLTAGSDEVRAWTIRRGDSALEAAAAIHSDLARGFIRAEVVAYEDLVDAGSFAEARKRGRLRSEGKSYVVEDGDVINILFNV
jgi:GTP-binding protein YchF